MCLFLLPNDNTCNKDSSCNFPFFFSDHKLRLDNYRFFRLTSCLNAENFTAKLYVYYDQMTVCSYNIILQLSLDCNFPLQPIYALNNILHVISPLVKMSENLLLNTTKF